MNKNLKYRLLFVAIVSCFLLGLSCDKSVEPVEPTDYPFYISATNPNQIFTFHPQTKKLDSIPVAWNAAITVSADGKLLYVALGTSVLVVDADSFSEIQELFYSHIGPVIVSPDNQYLALTGLELHILRTSDFSLAFRDTTQLIYSRGSFSSDSKNFYCASTVSQDSNYVVFKTDLSDSLIPVTRKGFLDGSVVEVIPSVDETKWFLYLRVGLWTSAFEVYDLIQDSIIFRDILVPGVGSMATTPNGKYVFYTSPGRSATDPPPDYSFKIFDVATNKISAVISDTNFFCISTTYGMECVAPKLLAVSPDSRWLGILGGASFMLPVFYLYDVHGGELVYRQAAMPLDHRFKNISVQRIK